MQAVQLVDDQLERMSKNTFDDMLVCVQSTNCELFGEVPATDGTGSTFSLDGIMTRALVSAHVCACISHVCQVTVHESCPLSTVYQLFSSMGLRHLVVVDYQHRVVGMVTRKDLVRCHRSAASTQPVDSQHVCRLVPDWEQLLARVMSPQDTEHTQGWFRGGVS